MEAKSKSESIREEINQIGLENITFEKKKELSQKHGVTIALINYIIRKMKKEGEKPSEFQAEVKAEEKQLPVEVTEEEKVEEEKPTFQITKEQFETIFKAVKNMGIELSDGEISLLSMVWSMATNNINIEYEPITLKSTHVFIFAGVITALVFIVKLLKKPKKEEKPKEENKT